MSGRSRVVPVPYFAQPTGITCQSTCLKMMATYLEQSVVMQSTGAADRDILEIWKDINEDPKRPVKVRNAHKNMKWWLGRHFPTLIFDYRARRTTRPGPRVDGALHRRLPGDGGCEPHQRRGTHHSRGRVRQLRAT